MRPAHNLLVISDLHLGEDLRAEAPSDRARLTEHALIGFLDHHAAHRDDGLPWRLVINGDMVDFVAIRLMPDEAGRIVGLTEDEHAYGLGDGPNTAVLKMCRVLERHDAVFRALARFVGAGNDVSLVIGNHDAAFHWPEVQDLLRHALASLWISEPASSAPGVRTRDEVLHAVEFHPWFFFEEGLAWIEHGHQYDPYCSFEDVLAPDTSDRQLDENIGSALMRYVGNHYLADMEDHWGRGFFGYLRFWAEQGAGRAAAILGAYRDMCVHLVRTWWARHPERVAARRERNRERLERLASRARVPVALLLRLRSLHRPPAIAALDDIFRAVMLDRIALVLAVPATGAAVAATQPGPILGALAAGAVLGPLAALAARPRDPVDPRVAMRRVSAAIRRMVRVPIVVFGHSHAPAAEGAEGAWYFNTGSWVGTPDGPGRAFTHLRVVRTARGVHARLCQWRDGRAHPLPVPARVTTA